VLRQVKLICLPCCALRHDVLTMIAQVSLLYGTLYLIFMWAVWLPTEDYWVRQT
jgi:hypothetical protein